MASIEDELYNIEYGDGMYFQGDEGKPFAAYVRSKLDALGEEIKNAPKYNFPEGADDHLGKRLYQEQDNLRERLCEDIDAAVKKAKGEA